MKSPAGVFPFGAVFGLAPRAAGSRFSMPYIALDSTVECIDDPDSRYYNLIVDRRTVSEGDWASSERVRRVGDDYAWGVVVEHNRDPRVPGKGSCIFIPPVIGPDGASFGMVTSGGYGPTVGGPIAMGYVAAAAAREGAAVSLVVRGKPLPAKVTALPFVPHRYYRG